ncbi:MAG: NapC/NirT family cytochrome c [Candidatus Limnocylindrales bacterium]
MTEPTAAAPTPTRRRFGRVRRGLGRIPFPRPKSRRGMFIVFVLIAGFGSAMTVGAVATIAYTDTSAFCGTCHTMAPEIKGYEISAHRNVACVECHTEPGLAGWFKAKLNGTRQLIEMIAGTFPTPIPAPDHAMLPSTDVTCKRCHNVAPLLAGGGPIRLVLHDQYALDPPNTRQSVALVVRPNGFGGSGPTVGVHWHIDSDVEYLAPDPRAQEIDYVSVRRNDGSFEEFIASRSVTQSDNVAVDVASIQRNVAPRRMDCIDCHNRVGHELPTVSQAVDAQITAGQISTGLPRIKEQAVERLSLTYASLDAADQSIAGLRYFYSTNYPLIARDQDADIQAAIASLQATYRLIATPQMAVGAGTYPNNIGHQASPGCFRCHDGAHYKIVAGKVTNATIPSQCSTCHTFPQIGQYESGVLIGQRPSSHDGRLWVFDHKLSVTSADPTSQTCGACHTRTYCENCHATTAINVSHDAMVTNHAAVVRTNGAQACAYCHAPAYCAQCHADPVLPLGPAGMGSVPLLPDIDQPLAHSP